MTVAQHHTQNSIKKIEYYHAKHLENLPQLAKLSPLERLEMRAIAAILPFRVNNYVLEELIDWDNIPDDPIYRLTFPHPDMLSPQHIKTVIDLLQNEPKSERFTTTINNIRRQLNPHPAGQKTHNVPTLFEEPIPGLQHKYQHTVLVFPTAGQTCHAYCTFCFRWPQFVNLDDSRFATRESGQFLDYIQRNPHITDVLFTGGDPMTMNAKTLALYIEPLLTPKFDHIQTIRIGTKSISYWPYRYVTDSDADDILRLFEKIVQQGKHLAIMAHYEHWQELSTPIAQTAIQRIRATGAQIRTQAPVIRHVNDDPDTWSKMWSLQVKLGCIPYYMFVERQTGAKEYFEIPLMRTWEIYQAAIQQGSGLNRTVRGPVMSALPGKVMIQGVADVAGETVFVLSFLQARHPNWVHRPFFAQFDPHATWLSDLKPAFGASKFFYEDQLQEILSLNS
jgi:KamA family protein